MAQSRVSSARTREANGPISSYDWPRVTPPVTTILMCCLTASSLAMFIAFVTTVTAGAAVPSARSGRVARARATSLVVVPPFSATAAPGSTSAAAGPCHQLLPGQLIHVAADGRLRHAQRLGRLRHGELPVGGYLIVQRRPPLVPGHVGHLLLAALPGRLVCAQFTTHWMRDTA